MRLLEARREVFNGTSQEIVLRGLEGKIVGDVRLKVNPESGWRSDQIHHITLEYGDVRGVVYGCFNDLKFRPFKIRDDCDKMKITVHFIGDKWAEDAESFGSFPHRLYYCVFEPGPSPLMLYPGRSLSALVRPYEVVRFDIKTGVRIVIYDDPDHSLTLSYGGNVVVLTTRTVSRAYSKVRCDYEFFANLKDHVDAELEISGALDTYKIFILGIEN